MDTGNVTGICKWCKAFDTNCKVCSTCQDKSCKECNVVNTCKRCNISLCNNSNGKCDLLYGKFGHENKQVDIHCKNCCYNCLICGFDFVRNKDQGKGNFICSNCKLNVITNTKNNMTAKIPPELLLMVAEYTTQSFSFPLLS